jgi:aldose 1-epimerase
MSIERLPFGKMGDGRAVSLFTLRNDSGLAAMISDYGGRMTQLHVPDPGGTLANVVLGFDRLEPYLQDEKMYFGPIVGRYALRIADGTFELDGVQYRLPTNDQGNTLHGGPVGFDKRLWSAEIIEKDGWPLLRLSYVSPHLEEGFPGEVRVSVTYDLNDANELIVDYAATTDRPTPLSFTNHIYLNLAGAGVPSVLDHVVNIPAPRHLPTDDRALPTGEILPVEGTELDFKEAHAIGERIGQGLANQDGGYDNYFLMDAEASKPMLVAEVEHPISGRRLSVRSDWPGFEFYTANKLDGSIEGIGGRYAKHCAFTLEPMWYPDTMHHANFPPAIVRPGQTLRRRTIYHFGG